MKNSPTDNFQKLTGEEVEALFTFQKAFAGSLSSILHEAFDVNISMEQIASLSILQLVRNPGNVHVIV
jgi:hypothetical protein